MQFSKLILINFKNKDLIRKDIRFKNNCHFTKPKFLSAVHSTCFDKILIPTRVSHHGTVI